MRGLISDCRHALRLYIQSPGASAIAVVVLAISMAFVSSILSLYVDLSLRPHQGFSQGSRIASIGLNTGEYIGGAPYGMVDRLAEEMSSVDAAASVRYQRLYIGPESIQSNSVLVTQGFFDGLQPRLALGRGFGPDDHDPNAEPVVILSHGYWQTQFNGDRSVLGTFLEISRDRGQRYMSVGDSPFLPQDEPPPEPEQETALFRIVGVMSDSLSRLPAYGATLVPETWLPVERVWPMFVGEPEVLLRVSPNSTLIRRAQGATAAAVANELRARYDSGADWRRTPGARFDAINGFVVHIAIEREAQRQLELLLMVSVLLALVAAANVSLFLLARAPGRRGELGVRMAVGAPIRRIARQLATEAGMLLMAATAIGLIGSIWLSAFLQQLPSLREADWRNVTLLDWRVLTLMAVVILGLGLAVSLAPIMGLKRIGIAASSREVTSRASPAQRLAGGAQITVAGALAAAAIAFGWHMNTLLFGDAGYMYEDRYFVTEVGQRPPGGFDVYRDILERRRAALESIPGVSGVAFGYPIPGAAPTGYFPRQVPDPADSSRMIDISMGSFEDRFMDLLGLELRHGRAPDISEDGVVVVNQATARLLWGRDDVVGQRIFDTGTGEPGYTGYEIVGVLEDLSFEHPLASAKPYALPALGFSPGPYGLIESRLAVAELQQALTELTRSGELDVEVSEVHSLSAIRSEVIAPDSVRASFTIAAAGLVVVLSAFGFYFTQRYLVAAGRREYAIRAALGAGPRALGRLVMWRGLSFGLPGLLCGIVLAFFVVALLRDDFVSRDTSPMVVSLALAIALVVLIAAASLGPALQARRTQPAPLLRED